MTDIFGPASAANAVTSRPSDGRDFPVSDTWFVDCTPGNTTDGTDINADFLNGLLAELRGLGRGNGQKVDTTPVVPDANDGLMLLRAVQRLIQRDRGRIAVASGAPNAITAGVLPPLPELIAGQVIRVIVASANTGPVTINVDGLGVRDLTLSNAFALPIGHLQPGDIVDVVYDGTRWRLFERTASETLYGTVRLATGTEVASRTPGVVISADKLQEAFKATGSPGVYSRLNVADKYAIMEGTTTLVGPGPIDFVLPEAYPLSFGIGFNAIVQGSSGRTLNMEQVNGGTVRFRVFEGTGTPTGAGQSTPIKWQTLGFLI